MNYLYTDGGVIKSNPSSIGGTFAFCIVDEKDERQYCYGAKVVTPKDFHVKKVTNNQTELWAIICGLSFVRDYEYIEIRSDSEISLGRIFYGYAMTNIPKFMVEELNKQKQRLNHWNDFTGTLLDGHPTKKQLENGIGKHGHPVSKWNKWCDDMCQQKAKEFLSKKPK